MRTGRYIQKLGQGEIYKYSPVKGKVELWDVSKSNLNIESRIEVITTIASLSYGNEKAKNPKSLYEFLREHGHGSCWEFIRFPTPDNLGNYNYVGVEHSLRNSGFPTYEEIIGNHPNNGEDITTYIRWHRQSIALFKIKVPLFIRSQYHRHRCCSFLELSRRYTKPNKVKFEFWYPEESQLEFNDFYERSVNEYIFLLQRGYKPEVARSILPQSLYTIFWAMKDYQCARNFYIERYSVHAQEQIREVAEMELKLLGKYQPEFLGQYVRIVGDDRLGIYNGNGFNIKILDIQSKYKDMQSNGRNKNATCVYCDFGDRNYYAIFNLEVGLFVGKIPKLMLS